MNGSSYFMRFLKNKKKYMIILLIGLLYVFSFFIYKVSSKFTPDDGGPKQHSYLYLMDFVSGYKTPEKDFEVNDVRFGADFLTFTLDIYFKPKFEFEVKKMAIDMLLGLSEEYPELDTIDIEIQRDQGDGVVTLYGTAVCEGSERNITWAFH